MTVVVVAAMPEEMEPLAKAAGARAPHTGAVVEGVLGSRRLLLTVTGEGSTAATAALDTVLRSAEADCVLGIGVGGGLTAGLGSAELVVARRVVEAETGAEHHTGATPWSARALAAPGVHVGSIVSVTEILSTHRQKAAIAPLAAGEAAVVDLESWSWADTSLRHGVPCAVAKCVCDPLEEDLPLDFERLRGPSGTVDRRRVIAHALPRPTLWPALRRLERTVGEGARATADWVRFVVSP